MRRDWKQRAGDFLGNPCHSGGAVSASMCRPMPFPSCAGWNQIVHGDRCLVLTDSSLSYLSLGTDADATQSCGWMGTHGILASSM